MRRIRIGVLGCASIARNSMIPAILSLPDRFELVAVASRTKEKAESFARPFGCQAVEGYAGLINREDIDAIYVPLPTGLHKKWIQQALQAGKHIYAEKSMAMNAADAQEMVSLAKEKGLTLMEGYMFQYHSQQKMFLDLIRSGAVGDIRHFSASFGFPPLAADNFRYDSKIGGGALMDCAGYTVRAAFMVLGHNLQVRAAALNYRNGTSLWGSAYMETSGAEKIGAALSFGFDNFYQCTYSVWGSSARATLCKAFTPKSSEQPKLIVERQGRTEVSLLSADNHFIRAMEVFVQAIDDVPLRGRLYAEIIEQSSALQAIESLSIR